MTTVRDLMTELELELSADGHTGYRLIAGAAWKWTGTGHEWTDREYVEVPRASTGYGADVYDQANSRFIDDFAAPLNDELIVANGSGWNVALDLHLSDGEVDAMRDLLGLMDMVLTEVPAYSEAHVFDVEESLTALAFEEWLGGAIIARAEETLGLMDSLDCNDDDLQAAWEQVGPSVTFEGTELVIDDMDLQALGEALLEVLAAN